MKPIIQKQQQILKQNLSKFENRATQITYSLNKIQYLLCNNHENEQNKDFIKNEYIFLKTLVNQVGQDLDAFQTCSNMISSMNSNSQHSIQPLLSNLSTAVQNDEIKVEEDDEQDIENKDLSSQSNMDDIDEDDEDDYDEQSQQKSNQNQGVSTRKKNIDKDKHYSSSYQHSHNRNNNHGQNNYSSSSSESQGYGNNKDYGSNRQVRKKKYSSELRKKLIQEVKNKNFSYRKICKKYNINYGTAYYLINSIQKEFGEQAQNQGSEVSGGNNSIQKSSIQGNASNNSAAVSGGNDGSTQINQQNNKVGGQQGEKQGVNESGRTKYTEEFKQSLYVESSCGISYKEISDKYKISYETCYYLISTIKAQVSKDSQLNKQLKAQIQEFKDNLSQNKGNSSTKKGTNAIPTTTTLTRAQQAILNQQNSEGQGVNTISIDDEDEEGEGDVQADKKNDEKQVSNFDKVIQNESQKLKSLNVLQEEEEDQDKMEQEEVEEVKVTNSEQKEKQENKGEQENENKVVEDKSKQNDTDVNKKEDIEQQKNTQDTTKATEEQNN